MNCDCSRCQTEGCNANYLCPCCLKAEVERLTAAIQRVRELADTWMSDGAAWGPYSARCILDALDGGCPTCEGPIRETVGLVCQTCGTDYGAQGDSDE